MTQTKDRAPITKFDKNGRIIKDSQLPLFFDIKPAHVKKAKCKDPEHCVIAEAMRDAFGFQFESVLVGASITKIIMPHMVMRFATPKVLREALKVFDNTGKWNLPPGTHALQPPTPTMQLGGRPSRWHKHKKDTNGSGRDTFHGRATPTRRVTRLRAVA